MADLKKLQELAKNGEVSKKLLEDEEFKSELKKAFETENGAEITDEQITEVIKKFETALQDEKLLKEAELENVSGGSVKSKVIKGTSAFIGAVISGCLADKSGVPDALTDRGIDWSVESGDTDYRLASATYKTISGLEYSAASAINLAAYSGGAYGGYKLGELICKKFNIK